MFDEVMTQEASAVDDGFEAGFLSGLGEEYAEDEAEQQEASVAEPQEESAEEEHPEEQANSEEESTEESATKTDGEKPVEQPEEQFEVTYMGEKKLLTRDEMRDYAEKGMNLDRVRNQLNDSRATIARLEAELTAPRAGETVMPLVRAYVQSMGSNMQEFTNTMLQAVRAAGITVEKPEQSNYMREKAVRDWQDFMQAYPEIKNPQNELPEEVWNSIKSGMTPRAALVEYRQKEFNGKIAEKDSVIAERDQKIAALEQEIRTLKLNAENKKKSVGALSSTVEAPDRDDFFEGFLKG